MVAGTPDEPVEPCPQCGSQRRSVVAFAGLPTGTGAALSPKTVAKEPDPDYYHGRLSKPARERSVGMDLTDDDGIERSVRREFDRKGNRYKETILNPDGSIYREVEEPLDEHWCHGSDKPKKSP
jgi:hypothetical protein